MRRHVQCGVVVLENMQMPSALVGHYQIPKRDVKEVEYTFSCEAVNVCRAEDISTTSFFPASLKQTFQGSLAKLLFDSIKCGLKGASKILRRFQCRRNIAAPENGPLAGLSSLVSYYSN